MAVVLSDILLQAVEKARPVWARIDALRLQNQHRVLQAFRRNGISEYHLFGTTGYGYNDPSREALGRVYADALQAETAMVQPQLISGTHAISACLFGVLRPGDHLLSISGAPYETLQRVIKGPGRRSLCAWGIEYEEVPLQEDGGIDIERSLAALKPETRMVMIQRSCGYAVRRALSVAQIAEATRAVHAVRPDVCVFVDNCYGEFVEELEPTAVGVDLMAGSLIKNPGGTLAPSGGYIAGRPEYVKAAADAVTAPGLGNKMGPTLGLGRILLQGLFLAPHIVGEALMGATVAAALFESLGFEVLPRVDDHRSDIVQIVRLEDPDLLLAVCRAVQSASPVDSMVRPEPGDLPGYDVPVVMAAGTFVQGSSLELSADGPMRPPYAVFLQGGASKEHVILALQTILSEVSELAEIIRASGAGGPEELS